MEGGIMFTKRRKVSTDERIAYVSPTSALRKKDTVRKCTRDLFAILNVYLWSHGVGYEKGLSFSKNYSTATVVSLLLTLAFDGGSTFILYSYTASLVGTDSIKQNYLALVVLTFLNYFNRILLCIRRPKFKDIFQRLSKAYDRVEEKEQLVKRYRLQLVASLLVYDVYKCIIVVCFLYRTVPIIPPSRLVFDFIPHPFAKPSVCVTLFLYEMSHIETFVTAYFCSTCFVLKNLLVALNKKLQDSKDADLELLFLVHSEVSSILSNANSLLHSPFLLSAIRVLTLVFREGFIIVFTENKAVNSLELRLPYIIMIYFHFAVMCLFGSSVINAASSVKASANNLRVKFSKERSLRILDTMNEDFEGFKLLNSIVIDESLIPSSIGLLVTYGILIATFNTSANSG